MLYGEIRKNDRNIVTLHSSIYLKLCCLQVVFSHVLQKMVSKLKMKKNKEKKMFILLNAIIYIFGKCFNLSCMSTVIEML